MKYFAEHWRRKIFFVLLLTKISSLNDVCTTGSVKIEDDCNLLVVYWMRGECRCKFLKKHVKLI